MILGYPENYHTKPEILQSKERYKKLFFIFNLMRRVLNAGRFAMPLQR